MPSVNFAIFFIVLSAIDVVLSKAVKIEYNVDDPLRHNEKNLDFNCTFNGITDDDIKEVLWYVNGKKIEEKDGRIYKISKHETYSQFIIKHPKISEDAGNVTCQIQTKTGNTLSDIVTVSSEPHVEFEEERSKNLVQGDPLTLKCKVSGSPAPTRIYWRSPKEQILNSDVDSRVTLKDSNATLKIKDIDFEDKGTYTCFASNSHGEYNATITVRVKDKLAALWPFLGICAEVFILCSIILIYERSRKKKDTENTVDDEAGDKLTNSNDNQVRQRRS